MRTTSVAALHSRTNEQKAKERDRIKQLIAIQPMTDEEIYDILEPEGHYTPSGA